MQYRILNKKLIIPVVVLLISFVLFFLATKAYGVKISFEQPPEVGDLVIVKFGSFVSETYAVSNFTITPSIDGELVWFEEHKELHFIPTNGFEVDMQYRVAIKKSSNFLASVILPTKAFTFAAVSFYRAEPVAGTYMEENRYIDVNLSTMKITLVENGKAFKVYAVAGKGNPRTAPTREGIFTIKTKEPNHYSRLSHVWMPWSMQYSGNYFIHEWPYYNNGVKIATKYSAGCIRLLPEDAKEVYDWVRIGTSVVVHSTANRLPVFTPSTLQSKDLAREISDFRVYIIKKNDDLSQNNKFKRHAWTEDFGKWYDNFNPFWESIKIVPQGTLSKYTESRWVEVDAPSSMPESRYVYELDIKNKTKHLLMCGENIFDTTVKPELCKNSWSIYGWPIQEIYKISLDEFNAYTPGNAKILEPAPHVI